MRNVVVHEYFDVDIDILWRTATDDIPALFRELRSLISELEGKHRQSGMGFE
jgi:uncharacterized protein with HEPN domain